MCIFIWPAIDAQGRARETREQAPAPLSRPNPLRGPTAKRVAGPEKNLGPLAPLSGPQATSRPLRGPSFCLARAKPAPSCPRLGTRPFGAPQVFPLEPYHSAFAWGQCAGGCSPRAPPCAPWSPAGCPKGSRPRGSLVWVWPLGRLSPPLGPHLPHKGPGCALAWHDPPGRARPPGRAIPTPARRPRASARYL